MLDLLPLLGAWRSGDGPVLPAAARLGPLLRGARTGRDPCDIMAGMPERQEVPWT